MEIELTIALFLGFFGLVFTGVPIAIALAVSGLAISLMVGISPTMMVQQMFAGIDSYSLLAIPLFILAGEVMGNGGITHRLVSFANALVGHMKGGLGQVTVVADMIMAGISGSGTADAAALGGVVIPAMVKEGYHPKVAAAINAAAATMGPIIPPSIMMIVYGAYGNVSIGALFLGGALPGIIVGIVQMATVYFYATRGLAGQPCNQSFSLPRVWSATKSSILALIVPFIVVGGLIGGTFTATEAAMVVSVYCIVVSVFVYKGIKVSELPCVFKNVAITAAHPMFCIAGASVFGWVLAYLQVPDIVVGAVGGMINTPTETLVFVSVLFMILGTFMDSIPAIITFLPIVSSLGANAGVNPVHMGVVVTVVLAFGLITPPYGLTLLLSADLAKVEVHDVMGVLLPFYISFFITIAILIYFPEVALALPSWLMPGSIQ